VVKEAIILAGGLGTRLRGVIKDIPKPMAEVGGKPFLEYLIKYLNDQGIKRVILSVGYKYEVIRDYFKESFLNIEMIYSVEKIPMGTGGAVKLALDYVNSDDVFILNGDTLFLIDLKEFYDLHKSKNADFSIALKKLENPDRYGVIEIDSDFRIKNFNEKGKIKGGGFINGGIYLLKRELFSKLSLPEKFSLETDFIEKYFGDFRFFGFPFEDYFIDIGVPEDYERAKKEIGLFANW
jgi:D-glycero-alpha-D-manno-heptose 1-phosphate guanylyltransferase